MGKRVEETIFIIQIIVQAAKEKSDEVVWLSPKKRQWQKAFE